MIIPKIHLHITLLKPIPVEHKITRPLFANIATMKASQAVRTVAFHPSGEAFVVGSNSRVLRICSAELLHIKNE